MPKIELPNTEQMFESINVMHALSVKKTAVELKIKEAESVVAKEAMTNEAYYVKGRPPSMEFLKKTHLFTGIDGALLPLRAELAGIEADYEREKLRHDLNRKLFDVWRTQSANERDATFV